CLGVRFAAAGKTVRPSSPCVYGALCGSISADEQGRSILCGGPRPRHEGGGNAFVGGKSLQSHLRGVSISHWRRSRGPGEGRLGKIGSDTYIVAASSPIPAPTASRKLFIVSLRWSYATSGRKPRSRRCRRAVPTCMCRHAASDVVSMTGRLSWRHRSCLAPQGSVN